MKDGLVPFFLDILEDKSQYYTPYSVENPVFEYTLQPVFSCLQNVILMVFIVAK